MSAYLLGNLIFIVLWGALFYFQKPKRKLQLFGSVLLLPFAILDIWFRPDYWHPPLLIGAIEPLSLETALYCFTAGGIAIVFGDWFIKKAKNFQIKWKFLLYFFVLSFGFYFIFQYGFGLNAMNCLNFSFSIIFLGLLLYQPKENFKSVFPGLLFVIFTIIAVNIGALFYPGFVGIYWNLEKLWPPFLEVPTEEIFFAGILGALWSVLPKYLLKERN